MRLNIGLTGKTALVCGASKGIGAAVSQLLAGQGARVLAVARNEADLSSMVAGLPGQGHKGLVIDLHNRSGLKNLIEAELKKSPIEILINNSGGPKGGPILEADDSDYVNAFAQHLLTNSLLAKLLVPGMKEKNFGRIVNIISTSVKTPLPGLGVSNTIRAAVASWGKTLSQEVAPFGITVNSVLPGYTQTDRLSSLLKAAAEKRQLSEEQIAAEWRALTPMGRFGEAEEVAAAVVFFASPAASFITGTALQVDGGRTGTL